MTEWIINRCHVRAKALACEVFLKVLGMAQGWSSGRREKARHVLSVRHGSFTFYLHRKNLTRLF